MLLGLFCLYTFTIKTHYCYHHDSHERFHGDCQEYIKEAMAEGGEHDSYLFPPHYYCIDIFKDAQFHKTQVTIVDPPVSDAFILPLCLGIISFYDDLEYHPLLEIQCRGGPPLSTLFLRGPPLV